LYVIYLRSSPLILSNNLQLELCQVVDWYCTMEDVFTGSPKEAPKMAKKRAIGEIFDMNMLRDIRRIFSENDNGDDSLNEEQFREVSRTL
jgi:hypothetical protein